MAHLLRLRCLQDLFGLQAEIAMQNLEILRQAAGERIQVINISGADFGSQNGETITPDPYRAFYKPHHRALNDWVHGHTGWKTHFHCSGSIVHLLNDFVEAGVDVLNPVQCFAVTMEPQILKECCGAKLVFWGGREDTQRTLPFGTPDEVRAEVRERLRVFSPGGGFVFNTIHNVLARTPVDNLLAMFQELFDFNNGGKKA